MGYVYQIPPDTKEEEKAIGGVITFKQFFWLLGGFVLGLTMTILTMVITRKLVISIIFLPIGLGMGVPFAFIRKHNMSLFEYLKRKRSFKRKNKKLPNMRKEYKSR